MAGEYGSLLVFLLPIALLALGAVLFVVFALRKKSEVQDNPFTVEEDIPEDCQPYVIFAGGKRVSHISSEKSFGLPYAGYAFWRRAHGDVVHYKIKNVFTGQTVVLNPLVVGVNLIEPQGVDKTGGRVIFYCNIDATNRVCEWDDSVANKFVEQMSAISAAHVELVAREKFEKLFSKRQMYTEPQEESTSAGV